MLVPIKVLREESNRYAVLKYSYELVLIAFNTL